MAKNSESKLRANHKYDEKTYDTFKVRLPKGSRKLIEESGNTYNGFLNKAFKEYCKNHGYINDEKGSWCFPSLF